MAVLFIDDEIFNDSEKWGQDKETFNTAVNKWIDSHYKGEDSESVYAMFNPDQVDLLQNFFKGFSVEMYRELNGTVELQIQKRNAKIKEKIKRIEENLDRKIDLNDWIYDGMVDAGKNAGQRCDLCPRPIRYGHFAVSKKTGECLRFGCNCAADFFNMDKSSLTAMHTIQANTLRDIKIIACVTELKKYKEYYNFMCGYTGKVILEEGLEGLRDLTTFMVKWNPDGKVALNENGECLIKFGDNTPAAKSLHWVKEHIISCMNADLDDDIYSPLEKRLIQRKVVKEEDKNQLNTAAYVKYAIKFLKLDLPVPVSLCKKLNTIMRKVNRQHHPDYLKYVQELLISHNLEKSALLKKVFTDFMINYLASSVGAEVRDPEAEYWSIRGIGTFYKTVLAWETAMVKLMYLKDFYSLVSQGYVTEDEFNKHLKSQGYSGIYSNSDAIKAHVKRCMTMFLSQKEVIKDTDKKFTVVLKEGYSKYTLKDVDDRISLCMRYSDGRPAVDTNKDSDGAVKWLKGKKSFNSGQFTPDTILSDIGLHYYAMQQSYKNIIHVSIIPTLSFLEHFMYCTTLKDSIRYLCALRMDKKEGSVHISNGWRVYNQYSNYSIIKDKEMFKKKLDEVEIDEGLYKEIYQKYRDIIPSLRKDAKELYDILLELQKNLNKPIIALPDGKKLTASNINSDYEELVVNQEKTNKDYFKEYCSLLVSKRGNKKVQQALYEKNLLALTVYKHLEPYSEMFKEIQTKYVALNKNEEEKKLYSYLRLGILKDTLSRYLNTPDMDTFIKFIAFKYYSNTYIANYNNDYDLRINMKRTITDIKALEVPMKEKMVMDKIDEYLPKFILDECLSKRNVFEKLYEKYKSLFLVLKDSKGRINFVDYYNLLNEKSADVEEYLKGRDLVSCDTFEYKIREMFRWAGKYDYYSTLFETDVASGMDSLLKKTQIYLGVKEITDEISDIVDSATKKLREEERRIEREMRIKGPYLDTLKVYLKEHIDFFEVDVDAVKKRYPSKYSKSSDVTVRQKEAFKTVKYQESFDESARFIEELNILGQDKWSQGVDEIINEYKKLSRSEYGKNKAYAEALRAEMYNHKLIYNHYDVTYKILKNLRDVDLTVLEVDEIQQIGEILKYYYIFKSQIEYIFNVLNKHNLVKINFTAEIKNIPEPTIKNIQDIVDSLLDKADSTGYTGLEKADMIRAHPDFATLPDYLRNIVSSVCRFRNCSVRQLPHVNTAFAQLGLGTPDAVKVEASDSSIDEKAYVELAKQIINHPDVKKAPELSVKIATTVSKTGRCSEKQAKHLDKAKSALGI